MGHNEMGGIKPVAAATPAGNTRPVVKDKKNGPKVAVCDGRSLRRPEELLPPRSGGRLKPRNCHLDLWPTCRARAFWLMRGLSCVRGDLRKKYEIPGNGCGDCMLHRTVARVAVC